MPIISNLLLALHSDGRQVGVFRLDLCQVHVRSGVPPTLGANPATFIDVAASPTNLSSLFSTATTTFGPVTKMVYLNDFDITSRVGMFAQPVTIINLSDLRDARDAFDESTAFERAMRQADAKTAYPYD